MLPPIPSVKDSFRRTRESGPGAKRVRWAVHPISIVGLTPSHPFSSKSSQITSDHPQIILLAPAHPAKAATGLYLRSRNLGTILTDWGGGPFSFFSSSTDLLFNFGDDSKNFEFLLYDCFLYFRFIDTVFVESETSIVSVALHFMKEVFNDKVI
jgi:hypothetical protein